MIPKKCKVCGEELRDEDDEMDCFHEFCLGEKEE